jgi:hypothetical protein
VQSVLCAVHRIHNIVYDGCRQRASSWSNFSSLFFISLISADPMSYPPLPDIFLDSIELIPWAFDFVCRLSLSLRLVTFFAGRSDYLLPRSMPARCDVLPQLPLHDLSSIWRCGRYSVCSALRNDVTTSPITFALYACTDDTRARAGTPLHSLCLRAI